MTDEASAAIVENAGRLRLERLSRTHETAFAPRSRGWSPDEIGSMAAQGVLAASEDDQAFALFSLVADEAELLTIAVAPEAQRLGRGAAVLRAGLERMRTAGVGIVHLEVAEDNAAARALYAAAGFKEAGRRPNYYAGGTVDALTLTLAFAADTSE